MEKLFGHNNMCFYRHIGSQRISGVRSCFTALRFALVALMCVVATGAFAQHVAHFDWCKPETLTPSYEGPVAGNPSGAYIGGVHFTDNGVTVYVDDEAVAQKSQRARFYFGYITQMVELRAYAYSEIVVVAPEEECIAKIELTGAKADESYLSVGEGKLKNGVWMPTDSHPSTVIFNVDATVNITNMAVTTEKSQGVSDITAEPTGETVWYTLDGLRLDGRPDRPGIYIERRGCHSAKTIVR